MERNTGDREGFLNASHRKNGSVQVSLKVFREKSGKFNRFKVLGTLWTDYISKNKINTFMVYTMYEVHLKHHISIVLVRGRIKMSKCAGMEVK